MIYYIIRVVFRTASLENRLGIFFFLFLNENFYCCRLSIFQRLAVCILDSYNIISVKRQRIIYFEFLDINLNFKMLFKRYRSSFCYHLYSYPILYSFISLCAFILIPKTAYILNKFTVL